MIVFRAHSPPWRTFFQPHMVLPPSWLCNWVSFSFLSFFLFFFTIKWVPWSEALLCGIPCWWIKQSASPWMVFLTEAVHTKKAKSYPKCLFISIIKNELLLAWQKQSSIINLPPGSWLISLKDAVSGTRCWSRILADWASSNDCSQVSLLSRNSCYLTHRLPPSLPTGPLYSWVHQEMTGMTGERSWLVSQDWLLNWLPKSSLDATFSCGTQPSSYSLPVHKVLSTYLFLRLPCLKFVNYISSKSLARCQIIFHSSWIII